VQEDRGRCINCRLEELERTMSAFERWTVGWYEDHATPFAMKSGIMPFEIERTGYSGLTRRLFIKALGLIHEARERLAALMAQEAKS
jgi:hypothetical protein